MKGKLKNLLKHVQTYMKLQFINHRQSLYSSNELESQYFAWARLSFSTLCMLQLCSWYCMLDLYLTILFLPFHQYCHTTPLYAKRFDSESITAMCRSNRLIRISKLQSRIRLIVHEFLIFGVLVNSLSDKKVPFAGA